MADAHLRVLDAAIVRVIDDDALLGDLRHATAFRADERDGLQFVFLRPFQRLHAVRRVAADADAERDVAGLAVVLQLADEHVIVGIIIRQRHHPAHVVVEREDTKPFADFVRRTFAKVGREVGGVGRAAAVAENKNLPVILQRRAQLLDDLRHGVHGDRIVRGLLLFDVIRNPLLHRDSLMIA